MSIVFNIEKFYRGGGIMKNSMEEHAIFKERKGE